MWVTKRLDRARERLRPTSPSGALAPDPDEPVGDVSLSLARPELERLIGGLVASAGRSSARPDSPALLAAALTGAIAQVGGTGEALVTRSPAGLYTPEYWHIRVEGADDRTREAVSRLAAGERVR